MTLQVQNPKVWKVKKQMMVCPHRNAFGTVVNHFDELLGIIEAAVVGSVIAVEEPWHTVNWWYAPQQMKERPSNFLIHIASFISTCVENPLRQEVDDLHDILSSDDFDKFTLCSWVYWLEDWECKESDRCKAIMKGDMFCRTTVAMFATKGS